MSAPEEDGLCELDETKGHLKLLLRTQSDIVAVGLEPEAVLALSVKRIEELTGADGAMVELADGDDLVVRAASGTARPWLGRRRPGDASWATRSVRTGAVQRRNDVQHLERLAGDGCARVAVLSTVTVPIRHRDRILGALTVLSSAADVFGDRDETTMRHMSDLVAASLARAETSEAVTLRDPMTGLASRALFHDRLKLALARARRRPSVTVFAIDVDDFARLNARLGRDAGDELLVLVGDRLREACRPSDTVARWGGDGYAVLADELIGPAAAREMAGRITRALTRPFLVGGHTVRLSASIGVAQAHDPYADPERVIEVAHAAMERSRVRRRESAPPAC